MLTNAVSDQPFQELAIGSLMVQVSFNYKIRRLAKDGI
jgi:hypothetical protein